MGLHSIQMPDVGEGITEAEIVEWHAKVGDVVREDDVLAEVMTDKATVEIPSPVDGTVAAVVGEIGDMTPVGTVIIKLEVEGEGNESQIAVQTVEPEAKAEVSKPVEKVKPASKRKATVAPRPTDGSIKAGLPRELGEKPIASPAVRQRAADAGIQLTYVHGAGPAGRITHDDLDDFIAGQSNAVDAFTTIEDTPSEEVKVVGLRRKIGDRMQDAKRRIPHITYVDEVDVTDVEALREHLNTNKQVDQPKLTILPFIMQAMAIAVKEFPKLNSHYDDNGGVLHQYENVHIGMAAQTSGGLMVPVIKRAETRDVWGLATEAKRLAAAAKGGSITREELTGSTITLSSLGRMGGVVSTPVINSPEVAIVAVNKVVVRPVYQGDTFVPRKMMNLSSSFDHRIVDGWDAAEFVQRVRELLEDPSTFSEGK